MEPGRGDSRALKWNDLSGGIVGKWEILKPLTTESGQAWLYGCKIASQTNDEEFTFVFKAYKPTSTNTKEEYVGNIRKVQEQLRQAAAESGVLPLVDCGSDYYETPFIWEVYPRARYGSLLDCLGTSPEKLPAPAELLFEVAAQTARALDWAHGLNPPQCHRDVKAANVFVLEVRPLRLALGDFGLARSAWEQTSNSRVNADPPHWNAAPEHGYASRWDYYSLGLMLLEISAIQGNKVTSDFYKVHDEEAPDWLEAILRIDARKQGKNSGWFEDVSQLPAVVQPLVSGLLVRDPEARLTSRDVEEHYRTKGKGRCVALHYQFPRMEGTQLHKRDLYVAYPQDFVARAAALLGDGKELPDDSAAGNMLFDDFDGSPSSSWIHTHLFANDDAGWKNFIQGYRDLQTRYGRLSDQRYLLFFRASFLIDPTCALPCGATSTVINNLDDLQQELSRAESASMRALAEAFTPSPSQQGEKPTLMECWIEGTQDSRSYWRNTILPEYKRHTNKTLKRLEERRKQVQDLVQRHAAMNPETALVLRYAALQAAVFKNVPDPRETGPEAQAPLLAIRSVPGFVEWQGAAMDELRELGSPVEAAICLLQPDGLGDHLRRSGVLCLWFDALLEFNGKTEGLGTASDFAFPAEDRLLTVVLAWEVLSRWQVMDDVQNRDAVDQALTGVLVGLRHGGWKRWWVAGDHALEALAAACEEGGPPRAFLQRLSLLGTAVKGWGKPAILEKLIPESELPTGALIVALALDPDAPFGGLLDRLVPNCGNSWWQGLNDEKAIGRWMLASGNDTRADLLRQCGALTLWLLAGQVFKKHFAQGQEEVLNAGAAMELGGAQWLIEFAIPVLTTRLGVLLAGAPHAGPNAQLSWKGADGARHAQDLLQQPPPAAPVVIQFASMANMTQKREDLRLKNVEPDLPGVMHGEMRTQGHVFGVPEISGGHGRADKSGWVTFTGNDIAFKIPVSTRARISSSRDQEGWLEVAYYPRGSSSKQTFVIRLKCCLTIEHGAIWRRVALAAVCGALVFAGLGWLLGLLQDRYDGTAGWWKNWPAYPHENLLPWGGMMESRAEQVPGYYSEAAWGAAFVLVLLVAAAIAFYWRLVVWLERRRAGRDASLEP